MSTPYPPEKLLFWGFDRLIGKQQSTLLDLVKQFSRFKASLNGSIKIRFNIRPRYTHIDIFWVSDKYHLNIDDSLAAFLQGVLGNPELHNRGRHDITHPRDYTQLTVGIKNPTRSDCAMFARHIVNALALDSVNTTIWVEYVQAECLMEYGSD